MPTRISPTRDANLHLGDQLGHRLADVGVQVVPDNHERAADLLVGGTQEPGVTAISEAGYGPVTMEIVPAGELRPHPAAGDLLTVATERYI